MDKQEGILEPDQIWIIPRCCREGWKSCTHRVQRPKPTKGNIGL